MSKQTRSIRSSNGVPRQSRLDNTTLESMELVKKLFKDSLNIYPSNSIIIRRAIDYYVNMLKQEVPQSWEGNVNYTILSELNDFYRVAESIYNDGTDELFAVTLEGK